MSERSFSEPLRKIAAFTKDLLKKRRDTEVDRARRQALGAISREEVENARTKKIQSQGGIPNLTWGATDYRPEITEQNNQDIAEMRKEMKQKAEDILNKLKEENK